MSKWYVHAHNGQRFGPIEREELDRWVSERRLTPSCQVWMEGWPEWRMAPEIFPQLQSQAQQGAGGGSPFGGQQQQQRTMGTAAGSPYAAPMHPQGATRMTSNYGGPLQPDRGAMILTFGILGLVICGIFSIVAWIMGSGDLKQIDAGMRDPAGRGMTQAGMILGIIGTVLIGIALLFMVPFMCLGVLAS